MTFAATADTIRARFNTEFPLVRASVPIAWDNVAYEPTPQTPWVRLTIVEGEGELAGLAGKGANLYRHRGVVIIQIFVPIGDGDGLARAIADDIATIFRGQLVAGVHFRAPSARRVGPDEAWWQLNVRIPYRADLIG